MVPQRPRGGDSRIDVPQPWPYLEIVVEPACMELSWIRLAQTVKDFARGRNRLGREDSLIFVEGRICKTDQSLLAFPGSQHRETILTAFPGVELSPCYQSTPADDETSTWLHREVL